MDSDYAADKMTRESTIGMMIVWEAFVGESSEFNWIECCRRILRFMPRWCRDTRAIGMQAFSSEDTSGESYYKHAYEVVGLRMIEKHLDSEVCTDKA